MREYTLIRSKRKTLALQIKDGQLFVRAPAGLKKEYIDDFVRRKEGWIAAHLQRQAAKARPEPDEMEAARLAALAREILPGRVEHYAEIMGLRPAGVRITGARTRFGSCSSKGRICFSWRLMMYPGAAVDFVVVHELAHLRHMDHGREFYALVESVLPDWRSRREMLR